MPSNILFTDTMFPQPDGEGRWQDAVREILNYDFMLAEQLRYTLFNLSADNFNTVALDKIYEPIYAAIESNDGLMRAELAVTAEGILSTVAAAGYATESGVQSQISQSAAAILLTVQGYNYATQSFVGTSIRQSAEDILATVEGYDYTTQTEVNSSIRASLEGLTLSTSNSSGYSTISLQSGGTTIATSGRITLGGDVVFASNLRDGSTVISGDNIQTGSISADYISGGTLNAGNLALAGNLVVYNDRSGVMGYVGSAWGAGSFGQTRGVALGGPNWAGYFIATDSGVRMQYGAHYIYVSQNVTGSTRTISVGSDRRLKYDINYDMERYERLLQRLEPCSFLMNADGEDGARHLGLIAQEVEEAAAETGLELKELALLHVPEDDSDYYGLAYSELIPLLVGVVKRLSARVTTIEGRMAE